MVSDGADLKTYVVVFKQQSGPSNVDRLVPDAGGTIVVRLEEIGGIGVESANPDFAAAMEKDSGVFAAGEDVNDQHPQRGRARRA